MQHYAAKKYYTDTYKMEAGVWTSRTPNKWSQTSRKNHHGEDVCKGVLQTFCRGELLEIPFSEGSLRRGVGHSHGGSQPVGYGFWTLC